VDVLQNTTLLIWTRQHESAIRDQKWILYIFRTVNEEIISYPMMASRLFMNFFHALRENAFPRNIAIPRKKG
jgi:hypothetical protein